MDLDQLNQIFALVREHDLAEFELEQDGVRLKLRRAAAGTPAAAAVAAAPPATQVQTAPASQTVPVASALPVGELAEEIELAVVKSPIVGTFYRSPEPGAPPFVEVGATIKKGQVLCVIEAMKLMNEIDAECDGEIVNIYVENGQPVQYGERLFAIKTK
ncbi:MAG TPA: acetyl-CoA carboxylase biotin carboxyl carrier protein [Vicinamibacterales bacterium]|jgi:acetyl-CoA carboxylase biotin carboxyl carrier protein|nr:acetyl-CoA carboxylase biotin carboxyl carrier protein [Vicinamibacterales bacterium]